MKRNTNYQMSVTIKFSQMISKHKVQRKVKNRANRVYRLDINLRLGKPAYGAAFDFSIGATIRTLYDIHNLSVCRILFVSEPSLGTKKDGHMMSKAVN